MSGRMVESLIAQPTDETGVSHGDVWSLRLISANGFERTPGSDRWDEMVQPQDLRELYESVVTTTSNSRRIRVGTRKTPGGTMPYTWDEEVHNRRGCHLRGPMTRNWFHVAVPWYLHPENDGAQNGTLLPEATGRLITHTPPLDVLDRQSAGRARLALTWVAGGWRLRPRSTVSRPCACARRRGGRGARRGKKKNDVNAIDGGQQLTL